MGISPAISRAASTTQPSSLASTTRPSTFQTKSALPGSNPENLHPSVHWFAAWNEAAVAQSPGNAFSAVTTYEDPLAPATSKNPLASRIEKASPTTHPAPATAPVYHVAVTDHAVSYVFADFEANQVAIKSNLQASPPSFSQSPVASLHNLATYQSATTQEIQASQTPTTQSDDATHRSAFFLTKAQYEILHVSLANAALYPSAESLRSKSADALGHGKLQARLSTQPGARPTTSAGVSDVKDFSPLGEEKFYHQRQPWYGQLSSLTNFSLKPNNGVASGFKFPSVAGFPKLEPNAPHPLSMNNLSAQIAYFRLRGAYAANAFEPGIAGYSVADQRPDRVDNSYDASSGEPGDADRVLAADDRKPAHKLVSLDFNPTIDANDNSDLKHVDGVYSTIWSGAYAMKLSNAEVVDRHPTAVSSAPKYRTVDVYDVFTNRTLSIDVSVYAPDEDAAVAARGAMADASMHRLLEFTPAGSRDYKGASVVSNEAQSKPIWILNDSYTIAAHHDREFMGFPEPTLVGTFAAAGSMAVVCRRRRREHRLSL